MKTYCINCQKETVMELESYKISKTQKKYTGKCKVCGEEMCAIEKD